ncbi:MAG: PilZ domain-containing protein [Candidatus Korobacteraceae bacterium]
MSNSKIRNGRSEPRRVRNEVVQVFGLNGSGRPFHQSATTVDISFRGARLRGLNCWEQPGEVIGIRCGRGGKARFLVVWIGKPSTLYEGQVGLSCLEPGKSIWDEVSEVHPVIEQVTLVPAAPAMPQAVSNSSMMVVTNRRSSLRYRATGRAQVREVGGESWRWSLLCDLGAGGCYLEMPSPVSVGRLVEANLNVAGVQMHVRGEVIASHPYVGMAVQFKQLSSLNQDRLRQAMQMLARTQVPV